MKPLQEFHGDFNKSPTRYFQILSLLEFEMLLQISYMWIWMYTVENCDLPFVQIQGSQIFESGIGYFQSVDIKIIFSGEFWVPGFEYLVNFLKQIVKKMGRGEND